MIRKRNRDRCAQEHPHQMLKDDNYDKNLIDDHFCEDAYGRNGHGLVSKS